MTSGGVLGRATWTVGAKHFVGGHVLDFFGFGYEIC